MSEDATSALPDFGEPMPLDELLEQAAIDPDDLDSAADWFDLHASDLFLGALEL